MRHQTARRYIEFFSTFVVRYERSAATLFFVVGFLWDALTLWRPDGVYENSIFLAYVAVATAGVILLLVVEKKGQEHAFLFAVTHFCLGSLVGGLLILYGRSGTVEGSFIFFLCGAVFLLLHEVFKNKYTNQLVRISVWYAVVIMYSALMLPVVYKRMDSDVFLHALITSSIIGFSFVLLLRAYNLIRRSIDFLVTIASIGVITLFFGLSYWYHILPPVPLALRHGGIYHSVQKVGDEYHVAFEASRIPLLFESSSTFRAENLPTALYCFSSVFAPSALEAGIQHQWELYLPELDTWIGVVDIPFPITGGRDDGYRGYSYITVHKEGTYRCSVVTAGGTLIGRRSVNVVRGTPQLSEKKL